MASTVKERLGYLLEAVSSLRRVSKDPGEFHRKQQCLFYVSVCLVSSRSYLWAGKGGIYYTNPYKW